MLKKNIYIKLRNKKLNKKGATMEQYVFAWSQHVMYYLLKTYKHIWKQVRYLWRSCFTSSVTPQYGYTSPLLHIGQFTAGTEHSAGANVPATHDTNYFSLLFSVLMKCSGDHSLQYSQDVMQLLSTFPWMDLNWKMHVYILRKGILKISHWPEIFNFFFLILWKLTCAK